MVKFLVVRFSSIGDIVLTTPVVRCLKQQVEDAEIHYFTKEQFASILHPNPYIDKVYSFKSHISECTNELKEENYDYIIDLHHNLRTYTLKRALNILSFSFHKCNVEKWLMVNFKINRLPKVHIVDRYLDTVKLFGVVNDNKGLDYFIPPTDKVDLQSFPTECRESYIALVIGAKHATKKLPLPKLISLCNLLKKPIVLLGGKEDITQANTICTEAKALIYNEVGKLNLNQSASVIQQADCVITHDTGLMHIAAAFKKRIVSVWGNTIPEFGMYPYMSDNQSVMFETKNLKCRPCSKIGHNKCPKTHFNCMNDINIELIANEANREDL